jgi:hypothetical protein
VSRVLLEEERGNDATNGGGETSECSVINKPLRNWPLSHLLPWTLNLDFQLCFGSKLVR